MKRTQDMYQRSLPRAIQNCVSLIDQVAQELSASTGYLSGTYYSAGNLQDWY